MKKILFLGNNLHVDSLIQVAKARGVYTIVTDNLSVEESPVKKLADEAWDVSVTDIDELEKLARANGIDGVLCGAGEVCMACNRELCKRLGLPFYVSDKAWEIVNNKDLFKAECRKHNIPVAKDYKIDLNFSQDDLAKVEYPVVVKPVDGCSSIGLHICHTEEDLIEGYKDAYEKSTIKRVVVEKLHTGDEVMLLFCFVDGVAKCIEGGDALCNKKYGIPFMFGVTPTSYSELIAEKLEGPLMEMFKELECKDGVALVQTIINQSGEIAVLEMNYRMPGVDLMNKEFVYNTVVEYAISGTLDKSVLDKAPVLPKTVYYCLWLKPGKITEIGGLDIIREKLPVLSMVPKYGVGSEIMPNSGMRQLFAYIIMGGLRSNLSEYADFINENLVVNDENGNDMVCRFRYDNAGFVEAV